MLAVEYGKSEKTFIAASIMADRVSFFGLLPLFRSAAVFLPDFPFFSFVMAAIMRVVHTPVNKNLTIVKIILTSNFYFIIVF